MWTYNKVLEYPIKIKNRNPKLAGMIISQYGGPDGELGASLRYLSQRFGMPDQKSKAILNDIRNRRMSSKMLSFSLFIVVKYQLLTTKWSVFDCTILLSSI